MYYSYQKNLLFASIEAREAKKNYFMNKIYKAYNFIGDKEEKSIKLKKIYGYRSGHSDTVNSIVEIKPLWFKFIIEQENVNEVDENIILCTSSYDSNLEVFKTNIKTINYKNYKSLK